MTFPWETLGPIVRDLYVTQDLKLNRVIEEVKAKHGYTIKSRTYREKFRTWKSRKSDYKEPKPKKSNRATRSQSRSSSHRVGTGNSPRKNSPVSTGTSSTNTRGRNRPTPVPQRDGPGPTSSHEQWPIYEDTESTNPNFEQSLYTSTEGTNSNTGFLDKVESTESNLVPMVTGPPLTHRSVKELTLAQTNTRESPGEPEFFQSTYPESTLPVQFGAPYMVQTPESLQWPMCPSCNDRNNSAGETGDFVPCNEMGCLYMGMPGIQAPSILYPTTAQIPTSGYTLSCPSLTWKSSQQETQSMNSVSDPAAEQNDFRLSPRGSELHYEDTLSMGYNERPENLGSLSYHLQSENTSSSPQSHQFYDMDNPHLSQIGSQMDAFPDDVRENYNRLWHHMQSQDSGNYQLLQGDESSWQGRYPGNGQAMNTITPEMESHAPLLPETFEQAMIIDTPPAGSYAFPRQNGFYLQDSTMATANEGFGMLYQQNNIVEHDSPFFAPLATSAQSTFHLSQHSSQSCESHSNTFNTDYSTFLPEIIHRRDPLGFHPTSEHRQW